MIYNINQVHTGTFYSSQTVVDPSTIKHNLGDNYIDPNFTKLGDSSVYYDGYKKLSHPPELFEATSVDSNPDSVYFDPTKTNTKLTKDNYTMSSKENDFSHYVPEAYANKDNEKKSVPVKKPNNQVKNTQNTQNNKDNKDKVKKSVVLNNIHDQSNNNTTYTPTKVDFYDQFKDNNIDNNKTIDDNTKVSYSDMKVKNLYQGNGISKSNSTKSNNDTKPVVNDDGSIQFNFNSIGTTWHYDYNDSNIDTQQKMREYVHPQPLKINGKQYNAGSPTQQVNNSNNNLNSP